MSNTIQIETVTWEDASMDFFRFGHGEDPLAIIPGLSIQSVMESADAVADAYQKMAEDFTVFVFDRRKELPAEYFVRDMAKDTAKALETLGLSQVDLFGASQGGMISMVMAIEHPELVRKLVLGSTSPCVTDEQFGLFEEWVGLAEAGEAEKLCLSFGELLYPASVFEQARGLLEEMAGAVTDRDLARFVTMTYGLRGFDITADLGKIDCPVLVLGAEDDRVLGAEASRLIAEHLQARPDFALHMYDGYGHAAFDTAPDYKERMLRFLTEA